jgi:SAM-dependent methyltransferase
MTTDNYRKHTSKNPVQKKLIENFFTTLAKELGKKDHPHLILKQVSIYELPYKDNSFDLVICTEVLEHLDDPQKALQEMVRVSKKYLLLSVPNEPIFMLSNFLRGKNWSRWGNDIEHINHWSSSSFQSFVSSKKLEVIRKRHPFPWTMLLVEKR